MTAALTHHYSPRLSDLDWQIVRHVPPGGNWKHVPEYVPSQRLAQIRVSYRNGEGSRSTYYGRLRPDAPAYTISTWFSRPGNGCHIHYEQDRLISVREAARLQSFPDAFAFHGSRTQVNHQIGNAVPPLLAYQIARQVAERAVFVDLFCGAGGLGLGLTWAGWRPVVANDIDATFVATYAANVHTEVLPGDIRTPAVFQELVRIGRAARASYPGRPLFVVGGPPCQCFSTAGNRRSMDDARNHLFREFVRYIAEVRPDGFLFENVLGLTNMAGGRVFREVTAALGSVAATLDVWRLSAEEYGVPQRRKRLFVIGRAAGVALPPPPPVCVAGAGVAGPRARRGPVSVREALDDLPEIAPGQDGSGLDYRHPPATAYQRLMRSLLSPAEFLREFGAEHAPPATGFPAFAGVLLPD
jgi:DNA (cytosine-5)-methyltransferase 1